MGNLLLFLFLIPSHHRLTLSRKTRSGLKARATLAWGNAPGHNRLKPAAGWRPALNAWSATRNSMNLN